jgi:hypothetical protein
MIAILVAVVVAACSGPVGQLAPAATAPSADLLQLAPPRPEDILAKGATGALGSVRSGSQFFGDIWDYQHIEVQGSSLLFKPGPTPRDYAYTQYVFGAAHPWQSLWLESDWHNPPALAPRTNLWFGLVNYVDEKFEWFGRESLGGMFIGKAAPYSFCWTDGKYYLPVYVVVTGTQGALLDELRLLESQGDITWELEQADPSSCSCRSMALALNAADEPRVFYEVAEGGNGYAERHDGTWSIDVIYSGHPAGKSCALVLDAEENPHLTYLMGREQAAPQIIYAIKQQDTWEQEVVVSRPALRLGNLVLDSTGRPHLVYYDLDAISLHYALRSDAGWQIEHVTGPCTDYAALSLTPDDVPQIAYEASSMLWYAYFKAPTWWFTVVDHEPVAGQAPALVHDEWGRINLAYFSCNGQLAQLRHAFWHGETATFAPVVETTSLVGNSLIVIRLDSQDSAHIAYSEYGWAQFGLNSLRYARFTGGQWHVVTVYEGLMYGESFGFDLDSRDQPHFCFSTNTAPGEQPVCLYYARPQ